jgi:AcrR family transcriptional regulator
LQRKSEIIDAAEIEFFDKVYDDVLMEDIAKNADLSKGTLYTYFKNKQSLYFAVVNRGMILLRDTFKNASEKKNTGLEKITAIVHSFHEYNQGYSKYYRLNRSSRDPRFANMLENKEIDSANEYISLVMDLFNLLKNSVILGLKDGTLRQDLDPIQTVMFLGSAIESAVYISPENQILLDQTKITKEQYVNHSIDVLLKGIIGEKN